MKNIKLSVKNLKVYFRLTPDKCVHAVDDVSFHVFEGETLGLVGESGCGKTTIGRSLLRLVEADEGEVIFSDVDVLKLSNAEMLRVRKEMQIIFQDPFSSLDPRKNVEGLIAEPLRIHKYGSRKSIKNRVLELLVKVGLTEEIRSKYPHELDGGCCQRIGIARALALNPSFIICDEPVSALDVSSQAQIILLLQQLNKEFNLTSLFISHDLSVVRRLSDRILVMYLGKCVESADSDELFRNPLHPYSRALISAIPSLKVEGRRERIILKGEIPTPVNPGPGCRFYERCFEREPVCVKESPKFTDAKTGHFVACHLHN